MILETICVPLLPDSADSNETSSSMVLKKKQKQDSFDDMFFFYANLLSQIKTAHLKTNSEYEILWCLFELR